MVEGLSSSLHQLGLSTQTWGWQPVLGEVRAVHYSDLNRVFRKMSASLFYGHEALHLHSSATNY